MTEHAGEQEEPPDVELGERRVRGLVYGFRHLAVGDGPGIRTTVLLKGCPLRCLWCSEPEKRSFDVGVRIDRGRCIDCGACEEVCPVGVATRPSREPVPAAAGLQLCQACAACVDACPANARSLSGRILTPHDVLSQVWADRSYHEASGGGMTISGGEPTAQPEFTVELLSLAKRTGIHTCVATSGWAPWECLQPMVPLTDLFICKLKAVSPGLHKRLTAVSSEPVLSNARRLVAAGCRVLLRVGVAPGLNDSPEEVRSLGEFIASLGRRVPVEVVVQAAGSASGPVGAPPQPRVHRTAEEAAEGVRSILWLCGVHVVG